MSIRYFETCTQALPPIATLLVLEHWLHSPDSTTSLDPLAALYPFLFTSLTRFYFLFGFQLTDPFLEELGLCSVHTHPHPLPSGELGRVLPLRRTRNSGSCSSLLHACFQPTVLSQGQSPGLLSWAVYLTLAVADALFQLGAEQVFSVQLVLC